MKRNKNNSISIYIKLKYGKGIYIDNFKKWIIEEKRYSPEFIDKIFSIVGDDNILSLFLEYEKNKDFLELMAKL